MLRYLIVTVTLLAWMTAQAAAQEEAELRSGVVKIGSTLDGKRRTGTGFVAKTDGTSVYIVTAAHVVEGDPAPKVEFFTSQNTQVSATVLKQDLRYDLALLKAESLQSPLVLRLETTAAPKTGDEVTTIEVIAPVQAEPAVIESQVKYEGYAGGCSHSVNMQMTQKSDQKTLDEQLLTQAQ